MKNREITKEKPFKLCFVCLGNICRSPTAEGIMQHLVNERGLSAYFEVDSAGTSAYHTGEGANVHSQEIANSHGIELHSRSMRLESFDLDYFDLLLAMDRSNETNIHQLAGNNKYQQKIKLLRDYDPSPGEPEVPDPYFGGLKGFKTVFDIVYRCCENLLNELEKNINDVS
jgi:protein-tyrosine phosphatase